MNETLSFKQKMKLALIFPLAFCTAFFGIEGLADLAHAATVTPPPAVAKAMAGVTHRYCQMVATDNHHYQMQHRFKVLGIKSSLRTGIAWPWVMDFRETCEPTKAAWRIYKQAQNPFVKAVRDHYHTPVWTRKQAFNFCSKKAGVKGVTGLSSVKTLGQYTRVIYSCFPHPHKK